MHSLTSITTVLAISMLSGCAPLVFDTRIPGPPIAAGVRLVPVSDERSERQIGVMTVGFGGGGVMQLDPKPPLADVLQAHIAAQTGADALVSVRVERLELKAKVGFGTVNDLTCEIESWATFKNDPAARRVRTVARNSTDFSSRVSSMGEAILPECLSKHAIEIVNAK